MNRLLALALLALPTPAFAAQDDVLEAVTEGRALTAVELDRWLETSSVAGVDALLGALREHAESETAEVRRAAAQTVDRLAGHPARFLASLASKDDMTEPEPFVVALHVIDELGEARDLRVAADIAGAFGDPLRIATMRTSLVAAAVGVLERDGPAKKDFIAAYRSISPELAVSWIDVLRRHPNLDDAAHTACSMLGRRRELDEIVLNRLQFVLRESRTALADDELATVRGYLTSLDKGVRRAACGVAERIDDPLSIPLLVDLLEDPEAGVNQMAHRAVKHQTGMRFGPSANRWNHWYTAERAWWEYRGAELVDQIDGYEGRALLDVLNELTSHAMYRRRIGPAVLPLLHHRDPMTVRMALCVLQATRCADQVDAIMPLLDDARPKVSNQAALAISELTGRPVASVKARAEQRRSSPRSNPVTREG